jgi:hypothetical protein
MWDIRKQKTEPGMVAYACNQETEAIGCRVPDQPGT